MEGADDADTGSGEEGGIGLSASEMEGAGDAGSMSVVGAQLIDTLFRSTVQGTIVKKRRRIMMESVDRAYRIKCEIDFIGGVRSEIGVLAWMMVSHD